MQNLTESFKKMLPNKTVKNEISIFMQNGNFLESQIGVFCIVYKHFNLGFMIGNFMFSHRALL